MAKTPTDLFRRGNATSPRMTQLRIGRDIITYQRGGTEWIAARSGSVSTFSQRGPGRNWWRLAAGFDYPDELLVVNDHGNHYNWEPNVELTLAEFIELLASVEVGFTKVL
jgi:hypothetical protein